MPLARDPCYVTAVLNVPTIGKCAAQLIDELVIRKDIALERFHVIGFSLGAQVSGEIGNHLQVGKLDRITGMTNMDFQVLPNLKKRPILAAENLDEVL